MPSINIIFESSDSLETALNKERAAAAESIDNIDQMTYLHRLEGDERQKRIRWQLNNRIPS